MTKYKIKITQGVVGDQVTEWMSPEEREQFWKRHAEYVEELKAKGEYLKEVEYEVSIKPFPQFDDTPNRVLPIESYRMVFIDLNNKENDK